MKETQIFYTGPMVRATLAGNKTLTRRPIVKLLGIGRITEFQPSDTPGYAWTFRNRRMLWNDLTHAQLLAACPYGQPGDRLWVRETWCNYPMAGQDGAPGLLYRSTNQSARGLPTRVWRPSIHMPRWACRLVLEIVSVRVEKLVQISEADALAEGVSLARHSPEHDSDGFYRSYREAFHDAWIKIYSARGQGWKANPWVWVIEFKRTAEA